MQQAMTCHQQGRLAEADDYYQQHLELLPKDAQALRLNGILKRETGDIQGSINLLARLADLQPDNAVAFNEIALTYMAGGQLQDAEGALDHSLHIMPGNLQALVNKAAILQFRGHAHAAVEIYQSVLETTPDDIEVRCNYAKALADTGAAGDALQTVDEALKESGNHPFVQSIKATILADNGRHDEAIALFEACRRDMPEDDMLAVNLGYSYQLSDRQDDACNQWREAVDLNPHNARAVADLAAAMISKGEAKAARELCEGFLLRHPGEPMVLASHGYATDALGESSDLFDFEHLIQVIPIEAPEGFDSVTDFNAALLEQLGKDESLIEDPLNKSTLGGSQTGELDFFSSDALTAFAQTVHKHIIETAQLWSEKQPDHPALFRASDNFTLRAWATFLQAGGHQTPHIHPMAWMSGVYYLAVPGEISADDSGDDTEQQGWIEFGQPPERHATGKELSFLRSIAPTEGALVLFPSYAYHRTIPFNSSEQRVSIAFDAVPLHSMAML